jgi:hypothetical protein
MQNWQQQPGHHQSHPQPGHHQSNPSSLICVRMRGKDQRRLDAAQDAGYAVPVLVQRL